MEALSRQLVLAAERRAVAEAAAAEAQRRLGEAALREAVARAAQSGANADLAGALMRLSLNDRASGQRAASDGLVFATLAAAASDRAQRSALALMGAQADRARTDFDRRRLADAERALAAERARTERLIETRTAARRTLLAQAADAERRARRAAARARTLRDLAQASVRRAPATAPQPNAARRAPAVGDLVQRFGAAMAAGRPSEGVAYATRAGAQVVAPSAARVAYAGPFRSFGKVLILEAERDYVLVLTGLGTAFAQPGDRVLAGEPLGEMERGGNAPRTLYFEVRRRGEPVDPRRWLTGRT